MFLRSFSLQFSGAQCAGLGLKTIELRVCSGKREVIGGDQMKKGVIAAVLLALAWTVPAVAAGRGCTSARDAEAQQALLFLTNLMVASSACRQNDTYAEFRLRNQYAIIAYQKEMIDHFRRAGFRRPKSAFDRWNTSLANQISLQEGAVPIARVCQQAAALFRMAGTLDPAGFHRYALAQAQSAVLRQPRCAR